MANIDNDAHSTKKSSNWESWSAKQKANSSSTTNTKTSKKTQKKVKKQISKNKGLVVVVVVFLLVGIALGIGSYYYLTKDDCFELLPYEGVAVSENDWLYVGKNSSDGTMSGDVENFVETEGNFHVKCVAFGKNISDKVTIKYFYRETMLDDAVEVLGVDENVSGYYYAVYQVDNIKYKGVQLIRDIYVLREED